MAAAVAGAVLVAGACSQPTAEDPAAPPAAPETTVTTASPDTTTTTTQPAEPEPAPETTTTTAAPDTTPTEPAAPEPAPEAPEPVVPELPERSGWSIQIGTEDADTTYGVSAAPGGDLVVAAATQGSLAGDNQGQRDVYLARYTPSGELRWALQTGGPMNDSPLGVSVAPDGSIYVGGFTDGDFASANQGSADVWLARFDADGNELWRRQFGGPAWDRGFDVTAFDGGAYITGYTASTLDPGTDMGGVRRLRRSLRRRGQPAVGPPHRNRRHRLGSGLGTGSRRRPVHDRVHRRRTQRLPCGR